jgi:HAMP domain-containing protein
VILESGIFSSILNYELSKLNRGNTTPKKENIKAPTATMMRLPSLKNLQLAQKLTFFLCLIFALGTIANGIFVMNTVNQTAQQEISSKAIMLMETMNAVREYTSSSIKPQLKDRLAAEFLPEIVPAYSANTVFQQLRKNPEYKEFLYREATLNPTNLKDKADPFESEIIKSFRSDAKIKEKTGFISNAAQGNVFYIARPLAVSKQSCLECHSTPQAAPPSMIAKYGSQNGFNWHLNEIIGSQMVFIPAQQILSNAQRLFAAIMVITIALFAITTVMVHFWLQRQVVNPITKIARAVEGISMGDLSTKFDSDRQDEIGLLTQSIDRLGLSLQMALQRIKVRR